jgi:microcystin degradation protein MlrC
VLIADYSDNPGGGGYGTTTALLAALLDVAGPPAVFAPLCDANAAADCAAAGRGSDIALTVGGEPEGDFSGPPLRLAGKVVSCGHVSFRATGPMWANREMHLGLTALLRCGAVDVVITSYPLQVTDTAYLLAAGVDVERARIIVIKSLQHFRAAFEPLVDDILFANSGGLVSTDYHQFHYRNVRRPVWPLDEGAPRQ